MRKLIEHLKGVRKQTGIGHEEVGRANGDSLEFLGEGGGGKARKS